MPSTNNTNKKPFRNALYGLKYIFKITPTYLFVGSLLYTMLILQGPLFTIAASVALNSNNDFTPIIFFAIFAAITTIFNSYYNHIYGHIVTIKLVKKSNDLISSVALKKDLEYYDNPENLSNLRFITEEAETRLDLIADKLFKFISNIVLLAISTVVISKDPLVLLVSVFAALLLILNNYLWSKYDYVFKRNIISSIRVMEYVKRIFFLPQHRFNNAINDTELVEKKYDKSINDARKEYQKRGKKILAYDLFQVIAMPAAFFFLLYRTAVGISRGTDIIDAILIISSFNWMISAISSLFNIYPDFVREGLFFEDFRRFLNSDNAKEGVNNLEKLELNKVNITFDKVKFSYQDKLLFKQLNLAINNKQHIAIVGRNGAGKTSLLNLLLRLYQPQEGTIYLNQKNYQDYLRSEIIDNSGVVEQEVLLYAITIGENILGRKLINIDDYKLVENALKIVEMDDRVNKLPKKIDTVYSKEFVSDGVYFSKGEMQRLSIARAIVSNPNLLILDEASSALDPLAEYQINNKLLEIMKNRTVIMVSHRLSITKKMDRILFIENGEIIEDGSHSELISLNQKYAEMYNLQKMTYQKEIPDL